MGQKAVRRLGVAVVVLVPGIVVGFLYSWTARNQFNALWDLKPGAVSFYTRPADSRYTESLARVARKARALGFAFKDPEMRQINGLFDIWLPRWRGTHYMVVHTRGGLIVADHRWLADFNDSELDCAVGHELGHVLDIQTGREGHMSFWPIRCMDREQFADAVGRMLCGPERFQEFFHERIRFRLAQAGPCEQHDVPSR